MFQLKAKLPPELTEKWPTQSAASLPLSVTAAPTERNGRYLLLCQLVIPKHNAWGTMQHYDREQPALHS